MSSRRISPLWFLVTAVFAGLVLPNLLTRGLFLDGMTYAAVSRNLAEGVGRLWAPHYTQSHYPVFYENPPLGLWLESLFFRVLGEGFWVEKFASLFFGLASVGLVGLCWKRLSERGYVQGSAAWPCLLFVLMPLTAWMIGNNMLELFALPFLLTAVALQWESAHTSRWAASAGMALLSGALLAAAALVKGPAQLFPLAFPLFLFLLRPALRRTRIASIFAFVFVGCVGTLALVWFSDAEARQSLETYLQNQLLASVLGQREVYGNRFKLLERLAGELALPAILAGGLWWWAGKPRRADSRRIGAVFYWLALSGSLPLLASAKQTPWYLFPSLPFFALALACSSEGTAQWLGKRAEMSRVLRAWLSGISAGTLALALVVMAWKAGTATRDVEFFADLGSVEAHALPERPVFQVCPAEMINEWALIANLQRVLKGSLTGNQKTGLWISRSGIVCPELAAQTACRRLAPSEPRKYSLYDCTPYTRPR